MDFFSLAMGMMNLLASNSGLSSVAKNIFDISKTVLVPIMVLVGVGGVFYSIYLGVNMARADSSDKREEAKKRMVNAIIGFVVIFVLVTLMYLFAANADSIFGGIGPDTPNISEEKTA
ncbi:MAG: hypothetical protein IJ837_03980 [Clostridia bacterium]|nr:hypothetical protein [Clostridia bacterium]